MIDFSDFKDASGALAFFEEFSKIPRGSGNTDKIADYLCDFAKTRGLEFFRDGANNVLIKKPATKGYEKRPTVIIQGHTDIVAEKTQDCEKDMAKDGLTLLREGDFIKAEGTTLGADDGVAMAYALALLDSRDIPHPKIEALFTSDEEIGLIGADAFDKSKLSGKILINIDSDEEGVFTAGCAGGVRVDICLPLGNKTPSKHFYKLSVSGLLGGHSGTEINKGRANAIKLCAELLSTVKGARIADFYGGGKDNAIPKEAYAIFATDAEIDTWEFSKKCDGIKTAYQKSENSIDIALEEFANTDSAFSEEISGKLISMIFYMPTGVIEMSKDIAGLPETSMNIGIAKIEGGSFKLSSSIRSAKSGKKLAVRREVEDIARQFGASFSARGDYPAWEYCKSSYLRDTMCKIYEESYGKPARVTIIHAGLECGIISDCIKDLDCVSIGPDTYDIHTTNERLSISSFARVWDFLKRLLAQI